MNSAKALLPLLIVIPGLAFFQDSDFKISTSVEMVLLDVAVQDPKGGYVSKLPKEAFRIEENGVAQTISAFSNADVPVEVGLVMDASGSMRSRRDDVNAAGVAFVEKSNPEDQVFVVNFNDTVREGLPHSIPFTDRIDLLRKALATGTARPDAASPRRHRGSAAQRRSGTEASRQENAGAGYRWRR